MTTDTTPTTAKAKVRPAPYSLRLTDEERAWIRDRAGRASLGSYIKSCVFSVAGPQPRRKVRAPVKDEQALADMLAALGASRIANNLNQLAKAANTGSLYFDEETKRQLNAACDDIRVMRQLLMQALGKQNPREPKAPESTNQGFARAVGPAKRKAFEL